MKKMMLGTVEVNNNYEYRLLLKLIEENNCIVDSDLLVNKYAKSLKLDYSKLCTSSEDFNHEVTIYGEESFVNYIYFEFRKRVSETEYLEKCWNSNGEGMKLYYEAQV